MFSLKMVLQLIAGIGLFLYGMSMMGDGLKDLAGNSLERILEKLTNSRFKGLALGTVVTGIIQSSAATCIMLLGFINANIMNLTQAIPVAFGANIGSTVTGQILRLGDLAEGNILLTLLKPSSFSSLLIGYGCVVLCFVKSKKKKINSIATVLLGLGILFFGMNTMESTISPLRNDPDFVALFTMFSNPLVGILVGTLATVAIQSSSASVGILQALSSTGAISWNVAIPIILGQNIGKCSTVLLGSIGASKDSKRLTLVHTMFNVFGCIIVGGVVYLANYIFKFPFWNDTVNRGNIADFHTIFNAATALVLLPFTNVLSGLAHKIIKDDEVKSEHHRVDQLDDLLLQTPVIALDAARKVTIQMGYAARENFDIASKLIRDYTDERLDIFEENERFLDQAESKVSDYLIKIDPVGRGANMATNEIIRTVADFERIGDYCVHIQEMALYQTENNLSFSEVALTEIDKMNEAIKEILELTVRTFETRELATAHKIEPLEQVIKSIREIIASRHIDRLRNNLCSVQAGISLDKYLTAVERIAGHCSNIGVHAIRTLSNKDSFDTHTYRQNQHGNVEGDYADLYQRYSDSYLNPVTVLTTVEEELAAKKKEENLAYLVSVGEDISDFVKNSPEDEEYKFSFFSSEAEPSDDVTAEAEDNKTGKSDKKSKSLKKTDRSDKSDKSDKSNKKDKSDKKTDKKDKSDKKKK
ncbi:MAG: Na/Pi cotransporter family protein [Lachnospiraceae bacterium]|nr:Na/Pi cotransporter family protein [Lachnospiraceae bacterium]